MPGDVAVLAMAARGTHATSGGGEWGDGRARLPNGLNGISGKLALGGSRGCNAEKRAEPDLARGIGRTVDYAPYSPLWRRGENENSCEMPHAESGSAGATVSQTNWRHTLQAFANLQRTFRSLALPTIACAHPRRRSPKMAVPTRTIVAPSSTATRKSLLMPIESCGNGKRHSVASLSRSSRRATK